MRTSLVVVTLFALASPAPAADYYVDAASGLDLPGRGTLAAPWKTITFSLGQGPTVGDRLLIAAGTYDDAGNGEVFPLQARGVALVGAGPDLTVIAERNRVDGVLAGGASSVEGIHFDGLGHSQAGLQYGLGGSPPVGPGAPVRNCRFTGFRKTAGWFDGAGISVTDGYYLLQFPENIRRYSRLLIEGNRFEDCDVGFLWSVDYWVDIPSVTAEDSSTLVNNVFLGNTTAIRFEATGPHDAFGFSYVNAQIVANTIVDSSDFGLYVGGYQAMSGNQIAASNIFAFNRVGHNSVGARLAGNLYHLNAFGMLPGITGIAEVNATAAHDPTVPSVDGDPAFVDWLAGDVHLGSGSAAIDRGDPATMPVTDFDGELRPTDGDGDGNSDPDIGADEAPPLAPPVLRRASLSSTTPLTPPLPLVFPFAAANPLTPAINPSLRPGEFDPDYRLDGPEPLLVYQVESGTTLLVVPRHDLQAIAFGLR